MSAAFDLPPELNIYGAVETRDALLAWLAAQDTADDQPLMIKAAAVAEVDGAGLQLLAALTRLERPWQLVAPSDALTRACATLGLSDWLAQHCVIA